MMKFLHRAALLVNGQKEVIARQNMEIGELQRCVLAHQRAMMDLAVAFRMALESPEIDIRDDLDEMIRSLSDDVAKLGEFVL